MSRSYEQLCPVAVAEDLVGERWTVLLLRDLLWHGPMRFRELEDRNPGLSTSLLTTRLRQLEGAGLVERVAATGHYRLTEQGQRIRGVIDALYEFGWPLLERAPLSEEMLRYVLASTAKRRHRELLELDRQATIRLEIDGYDTIVAVRPGFLGLARAADADAILSCSQAALVGMLGGGLTLDEALADGSATVAGDADAVRLLTELLRGEPAITA